MAAASTRAPAPPFAAALHLPAITPRTVVVTAGLTALLMGALMAMGAQFAFALLAAVAYVPLALASLPLGIALWFPTVFISYLPGLADPAHAAAILLGLAWLGMFGARGVRPSLPQGAGAVVGLGALLLLWQLLSLAWSQEPGDGVTAMIMWTPPFLLLGMVTTTVRREDHLRWLVIAFVVGAVLSVLIGLLSNGLTSSASAIDTATQQEGRLQGGAGDPNVLAAGVVPAIILAAALALMYRGAAARIAIGFSILVLALGLAATESRGGMLAMAVALVASVAVAKGRRGAIVALAAISLGGAAAWFVNTPTGLERITSFDGGGNGRSDLWAVGADMARDHPIVGVGLGNFPDRAAEYVRQPRELQFVDLIAEEPHVAHNTYLQIMAENGLVGLLLFCLLAAAALRACLLAARAFDEVGDDLHATLARAVFVGTLALLAASIFLTNGHDSRLWLLFGLSVVLLGLARARRAAAAPLGRRSG